MSALPNIISIDRSEKCSHCGGLAVMTKNVPVGHPDFGKAFPCGHCEQGREIEQRKIEGMPAHYRDFRLATFDKLPERMRQGKMLARAATEIFIERRGKAFGADEIYGRLGYGYDGQPVARFGLVLYGDYGMGKTGMAATIYNELRLRDEACVFMTVKNYIKQVQAGYRDDSLRGFERQVQQVPFPIVDEINLENYSADRLEIVGQFIESRNAARKPYVLTTNLNIEQFEIRWGSFIATRVNSNCHWIPMDGVRLRNEGVPLGDPTLAAGG